MNSSSAQTVVVNRGPPFKPCSALAAAEVLRPTHRFSTPVIASSCGLLKQPDKHKMASARVDSGIGRSTCCCTRQVLGLLRRWPAGFATCPKGRGKSKRRQSGAVQSVCAELRGVANTVQEVQSQKRPPAVYCMLYRKTRLLQGILFRVSCWNTWKDQGVLRSVPDRLLASII